MHQNFIFEWNQYLDESDNNDRTSNEEGISPQMIEPVFDKSFSDKA